MSTSELPPKIPEENEIPSLPVMLLSPDATIPTRGSASAAGYDLASAVTTKIFPGGKTLIRTDLCFSIPDGYYGRVAPRSGFSWKKHTHVGAGVIDSDYRGNVRVLVFNLGTEDVVVTKGDRIAQLILEKITTPPIRVVPMVDETSRGASGFGSTGK